MFATAAALKILCTFGFWFLVFGFWFLVFGWQPRILDPASLLVLQCLRMIQPERNR